eukprot:11178486-Lingulodinium_polyedra.AAC.1
MPVVSRSRGGFSVRWCWRIPLAARGIRGRRKLHAAALAKGSKRAPPVRCVDNQPARCRRRNRRWR